MRAAKKFTWKLLQRPLLWPGKLKKYQPTWHGNRRRNAEKGDFAFRLRCFSHLLFSFSERPMLLFGFIAALFTAVGLGIGAYLTTLWISGALTAGRPLFTLMALLITTGIQVLVFGFIGIEISNIKREIYRIQKGPEPRIDPIPK